MMVLYLHEKDHAEIERITEAPQLTDSIQVQRRKM